MPGIEVVNHFVNLVHGSVGFVIKLIVGDQLPDATLPLGDFAHQVLKFIDRGVDPVVQSGIVDQLAHRTLTAFHKRNNAIHPLQQDIHILQAAVGRAHHIFVAGDLAAEQHISILDRSAFCGRAVNVDVGLTENTCS